MILVLGGTSDANLIGDRLKTMGVPFMLSVTSDYGVQMAQRHKDSLLRDRFDREGLVGLLETEAIEMIIDATHPHAGEISKLAMETAMQSHCHYLRYERPTVVLSEQDSITLVDTVEEAALKARQQGHRILVTGSKHLKEYTSLLADKALFIRVIPSPAVIQEALDLGIASDRIIAMKGPFTEQLNAALFEALGIEVLITKESGEAGGFLEKINSARICGIHAVVIRRPRIEYQNCKHSLEDIEEAVMKFLKGQKE